MGIRWRINSTLLGRSAFAERWKKKKKGINRGGSPKKCTKTLRYKKMDTPAKKPTEKKHPAKKTEGKKEKTVKPKENKVKKEGPPRKKANRYRKIWNVEKEDAEHLKGLVYTLQKLKNTSSVAKVNKTTIAKQQEVLAHLLLEHRMLREDNPLILGGEIPTKEEALPPSPDSLDEFLNLDNN